MFDLDTGWNFERVDHGREFLHWLNVTCPDFVWFAPPCKVWYGFGPLSNS